MVTNVNKIFGLRMIAICAFLLTITNVNANEENAPVACDSMKDLECIERALSTGKAADADPLAEPSFENPCEGIENCTVVEPAEEIEYPPCSVSAPPCTVDDAFEIKSE